MSDLLDSPRLHIALATEIGDYRLGERAQISEVSSTPPGGLSAIDAVRMGWRRVLTQLQTWRANPLALAFDDSSTPGIDVLENAIDLARQLRALEWAAPDQVVPTIDGGISFERRAGSCFESIELEPTGKVTFLTFKDGVLEHQGSI